jgi:hypothetical protein
MIVKTVLAFIVTASLAGGVVYYGTQSIEDTTDDVAGNDAATEQNITAIQNQLSASLNEIEPAASDDIGDETGDEAGAFSATTETTTTITTTETITDDRIEQLDAFEFSVDQAELLTDVQLKDQAYLNIITYALEREMYGEVDQLLGKIQQAGMRDVARGQIAATLTKHGYVNEALEFIDTAEIEKSRDQIRSQIISSLLAADQ